MPDPGWTNPPRSFTGLAGLAGVMLIRVWVAHRLVGSRKPGWKRRYLGHIYFVYV